MKQTLEDIKVKYDQTLIIYCDNTSAISISKNPVMHSKTKHIAIKYVFLREQAHDQTIKLEYVNSKDQITDIFTNPLPREYFETLRDKLGVISSSQQKKH